MLVPGLVGDVWWVWSQLDIFVTYLSAVRKDVRQNPSSPIVYLCAGREQK